MVNKPGLGVKEAFESISREKIPLYLQTDKGIEFKNTLFQGQLTEYEIKFYTSENDDIKADIVERFNRTLKLACVCTLRIQNVIDILTCYRTWCARTTVLIALVLEWHPPLLMLKRSV